MSDIQQRKEIEEAKKLRQTTVVERDRDAIEHGELHVKAAVTPDKPGFRRARIWFPRNETVVIPADSLNKERYLLIKEENMLNVVEVPPGKSGKKKDEDKTK